MGNHPGAQGGNNPPPEEEEEEVYPRFADPSTYNPGIMTNEVEEDAEEVFSDDSPRAAGKPKRKTSDPIPIPGAVSPTPQSSSFDGGDGIGSAEVSPLSTPGPSARGYGDAAEDADDEDEDYDARPLFDEPEQFLMDEDQVIMLPWKDTLVEFQQEQRVPHPLNEYEEEQVSILLQREHDELAMMDPGRMILTPRFLAARNVNQVVIPTDSYDEERFKFKVSIYSKVSGCRMTNLSDYTIVKQLRVVALQYITGGNPHPVLGIKFAYEKMKNGGLQVITDDERLTSALALLNYFATIPCKITFPSCPRVVGFIKDLPVDIGPAELKSQIKRTVQEVYSVRYITEKPSIKNRQALSPCAFISFNLRYLPGSVVIYDKTHEVLVPNPMQCSRCCRYGHQGKQCKAEIRCPICGYNHSKHHCTSQSFHCVNCNGNHASTSHECKVWQEGKLMNELRYRGGLSAEEAINISSNKTIEQKKHLFVAPADYFDKQEAFYLGVGVEKIKEEDGPPPQLDTSTSLLDDPIDVPPYHDTHAESRPGPHLEFHPHFMAGQEFLDVLTDFFLRLTNPNVYYRSSVLMPGIEDPSRKFEPIVQQVKKPSAIAQQFKLNVLKAVQEANESVEKLQDSVLELEEEEATNPPATAAKLCLLQILQQLELSVDVEDEPKLDEMTSTLEPEEEATNPPATAAKLCLLQILQQLELSVDVENEPKLDEMTSTLEPEEEAIRPELELEETEETIRPELELEETEETISPELELEETEETIRPALELEETEDTISPALELEKIEEETMSPPEPIASTSGAGVVTD